MRIFITLCIIQLLAACQSSPRVEDDPRYAKLATVMSKREFSKQERDQARESISNTSVHIGIGFGMGYGSHGSFGGMMMGMDNRNDERNEQPLIAKGAIRYTVQPLGSQEKIEMMSYTQHKVGDCVKVLISPPAEFPRLLDLKNHERCK